MTQRRRETEARYAAGTVAGFRTPIFTTVLTRSWRTGPSANAETEQTRRLPSIPEQNFRGEEVKFRWSER